MANPRRRATKKTTDRFKIRNRPTADTTSGKNPPQQNKNRDLSTDSNRISADYRRKTRHVIHHLNRSLFFPEPSPAASE
jgi:hypothetical protein